MFYYSALLFFSFAGSFQFYGAVQFWMLLSGSGDMSSVIHYLPCFGEWLITCLLSVFTALPVFVY
jgi:hypothetical protein